MACSSITITKTVTCGDWVEIKMEEAALGHMIGVTLEQYRDMVVIRVVELEVFLVLPIC